MEITARDLSLTPANIGDGPTGSTSSSSGGSCSSTGGLTNSPREAHVRLLLQPEVDQRRRQSARSVRLGVDTQCVFDERFKFPVSHDHLADKTLRFQVMKLALDWVKGVHQHPPGSFFMTFAKPTGRRLVKHVGKALPQGRNYSIIRLLCVVVTILREARENRSSWPSKLFC